MEQTLIAPNLAYKVKDMSLADWGRKEIEIAGTTFNLYQFIKQY